MCRCVYPRIHIRVLLYQLERLRKTNVNVKVNTDANKNCVSDCENVHVHVCFAQPFIISVGYRIVYVI